jgi:pyridoxal phosphate enzyme (YggS family)
VAACARSGRSEDEVTLVAVTKTHPASVVQTALSLGVADIGESYVQEWREKASILAELPTPPRWHFIGHLQSNKVKYLVGRVHLVHSVDRASLVTALAERSRALGVTTSVLLEVNVAGEAQKSGCSPQDALALARQVVESGHLALRGLMTVAPFEDDPEQVRPVFRALRELRDQLRASLPAHAAEQLTELSMGMTGDLEVAIEEGATLVRVGTALFGARPP